MAETVFRVHGERQQVDATLDLTEPCETWKALSHGFRVVVHNLTWRADDIARVPLGALFRQGSDWAVYRVVNGRTVLTPVKIDHRNGQFAEVMEGLAAGDQVILHPSDTIANGASVENRAG